jgi:hypothetical protein
MAAEAGQAAEPLRGEHFGDAEREAEPAQTT